MKSNMKPILRSIIYLMILVNLAACANLRKPATDTVIIETVFQGASVDGASCVVNNRQIQLNITTPASIVIPAQGDLRIVCERSGYVRTEFVQRLALPPPPTSNTTVGVSLGGVRGNVGLGVGTVFPLVLKPRGGGYPARITVELPLAL